MEKDQRSPVKVEIVTDKPIPVEIKGDLAKELLTTGLSAALGRGVNLLIDWITKEEKQPPTPSAATTIDQSTTPPEITPSNQPVVVIQQTVSSKIWVVLLVVGGMILAGTQIHSCSEIDRLKEKVVELENRANQCNNK